MEEKQSPPVALVVEDDEIVAELLTFMLEREGLTVVRAADGRQAMDAIDSRLDLSFIMMDVRLPYRDGFELLREIRRRPEFEKVPIMMLTAQVREDEVSRALELGANDYLIKPFKPMEMIARVKRLLKK